MKSYRFAATFSGLGSRTILLNNYQINKYTKQLREILLVAIRESGVEALPLHSSLEAE